MVNRDGSRAKGNSKDAQAQATAGKKAGFNQPKLLYRAVEVAHLCSVSISSVWRWTQRVNNALPVVRISPRCTRFKAEDVKAFIEGAMNG